jgi:cyclopropane fatty-acyl-phospholipid synthase-like methyltransferase
MDCEREIKSMKLYNNIERIHNELKEANMLENKLEVEDILKFVCLNYTGKSGCDKAIQVLQLNENSHLLDIGCGVGGPSLYISASTRCKVSAVDLQKSNIDCLRYLSKRCELEQYITPVHCNIFDLKSENGMYDAVVSVLAILHIPLSERRALFQTIFSLLRPGGKLYIEDYYQLHDFTAEEVHSLATNVYCHGLPSAEQYSSILSECNFEDIYLNDQTEEWKAFTIERYHSFSNDQPRFERVHGAATFESLNQFYNSVKSLFEGNHLGGAIITATKPQGL